MNNIIKRTWKQSTMVNIEDLQGMTFQAEEGGHTFVISGVDENGSVISFSGTPAGVMLKPDNTDQALTCSISDGKVYATLPAECYDVPGRFGLTIFVTSDSQKTAIYAAVGNVGRTSSGVASAGTTASVVDLINAINAAIANIPASDTNLKAAMAPIYSSSALYEVGDYAWYDGVLKKCIVAITTAETYTAAHWTNANLGGDISSLKSAISKETRNIWRWGDVTVTGSINLTPNGDANIPAGTYTLSGEITRTASGNCRLYFYKNSIGSSNELVKPYIASGNRNSTTFTLAEKADYVVIASGPTQSDDQTATWKNVQIETGGTATKYIPHITATDFIAREDISTNNNKITALETTVNKATKNLWTYGDQSFTKVKSINVDIAPGIYTLSAEVTASGTGEPDGKNKARVEFFIDSTSKGAFTITKGGRCSCIVDLSSSQDHINKVKLCAANTEGNSTGFNAVWNNIQLEAGTFATPYEAPTFGNNKFTHIDKDIIYSAENLTFTKSEELIEVIVGEIGLKPISIDCVAKWEGTETDEYHVPEIRFVLPEPTSPSCRYNIGAKGSWKENKWRMTPILESTVSNKNMVRLQMFIPSGLTLSIKKLIVRYDDTLYRPFSGAKFDVHGAFMGYPEHSKYSFNAAQKCGASYFVTIPKVSSDGEWFCYHDDTFNELTTILRNADGTAISGSEYNGLAFNQIPWTWLKTLDSGVYKGNQFAGCHLMKVSELLELCNITGIHPVFSWHPASTQAEVEAFKSLLEKYNMLDKTTILPGDYFFTDVAYPVFGNQIEMYKLGIANGSVTTETLNTLITMLNNTSGLDKSKVCIALWVTDMTETYAQTIRSSGYLAGVHEGSHTTVSGASLSSLSAGDIKYLQSIGVTVFTTTYNPSFGLNWM